MPQGRPNSQEPALVEDPLALAHGDPDLRRGLADGLIVNGVDPFAERRRMMRERQTGRPDPASPPPQHPRKETRMSVQPSPVHLTPEQRSGATMLRPAEQTTSAGLHFTRISRQEFDAASGRSHSPDVLTPAIEGLDRGECIKVGAERKKQAPLRQQLRKAAARRGFQLQIKSGPDYLLVRKADAQEAS